MIFTGVSLQSLAWLPIIALAFLPSDHSVALLIACVVLYYIGGQFAAPPWSSLIGDLVPERRRGRFFGERTRGLAAPHQRGPASFLMSSSTKIGRQ